MPTIKGAIESIPALFALANARRRKDRVGPKEIAGTALRFSLFRPLQVPEELTSFLQIVAELKPRTVLEIGTCRGGTLFSFCLLAPPDATIVSVDLPNGPFGGGYDWLRIPIFRLFASGTQALHLIRDNSHSQETFDRVAAILEEERLDLLFIDGDHTYEGVRRDFDMYSPLVQRGGIVALHDIVEHPPEHSCGVNSFWREVKLRHKSLEIVKDWRQQWGGIGVLYM